MAKAQVTAYHRKTSIRRNDVPCHQVSSVGHDYCPRCNLTRTNVGMVDLGQEALAMAKAQVTAYHRKTSIRRNDLPCHQVSSVGHDYCPRCNLTRTNFGMVDLGQEALAVAE